MVDLASVATLLKLVIQFIPPPKPYKPDYSRMESSMNQYYDNLIALHKRGIGPEQAQVTVLAEPEVEVIPGPRPLSLPEHSEEPDYGPGGKAISTSCINCSRSHLVTIAGALEEGLRFAREGGIMHPEAIKRLSVADKEINIMERVDLTPEAIQRSPEEDQKLARYFLPKIRQLRQDIGNVKTAEDLEKVAAESSVLAQEFRLRQMQRNGVNLNPVMELAKKVQAGEITMEEAREQVKKYLPKES